MKGFYVVDRKTNAIMSRSRGEPMGNCTFKSEAEAYDWMRTQGLGIGSHFIQSAQEYHAKKDAK